MIRAIYMTLPSWYILLITQYQKYCNTFQVLQYFPSVVIRIITSPSKTYIVCYRVALYKHYNGESIAHYCTTFPV